MASNHYLRNKLQLTYSLTLIETFVIIESVRVYFLLLLNKSIKVEEKAIMTKSWSLSEIIEFLNSYKHQTGDTKSQYETLYNSCLAELKDRMPTLHTLYT